MRQVSIAAIILLTACGSATEPSDPAEAWLGWYFGSVTGILFEPPPRTDSTIALRFDRVEEDADSIQSVGGCDASHDVFITILRKNPEPMAGYYSIDWICLSEQVEFGTRLVLEADGEWHCRPGFHFGCPDDFYYRTRWSLDLTLRGDTITGRMTADDAMGGYNPRGPIDVQVLFPRKTPVY